MIRTRLPRVHDAVVRELGARIAGGLFAPGDSLPNEDALSRELGVSRTSIREAIRVLSAKGIVESRPRAGMRVREREHWNRLDPAVIEWHRGSVDVELIRSLIEARFAIEPEAAALAAVRATPEELGALERALARMRSAPPHELKASSSADLAFHAGILGASHNIVFHQLVASIGAALSDVLELAARVATAHETGLAAHEEILDAIRTHDPERARRATVGLLCLTREQIEPALAAAASVNGNARLAGRSAS